MEQKDFFVGERICLLRTAKRMTQEQLALLMNVSPAAVSKWERNLASPGIEMLWRLADFFDCSIDALVGRASVRADTHEKESKRLAAVGEDLLKCSEISRAKGLIAMEEAVPAMKGGSRFLPFALSYAMYLFMRQMDVERTFEFLGNHAAALPEAERMEGKMIVGALKMIFAGEHPEIIKEYVASCIGMEYREKMEGAEGMSRALRRCKEEILNLYREKKQYSENTGLLEDFGSVGDYEIQMILCQMDQETMAAALAGASGAAALAFMSNMSDRALYAISEDIQCFEGTEEDMRKAQMRVLEIKRLLADESGAT